MNMLIILAGGSGIHRSFKKDGKASKTKKRSNGEEYRAKVSKRLDPYFNTLGP